MLSTLSEQQARSIASQVYPSGRPPLTTVRDVWNADDVRNWTTNVKTESTDKTWKSAGLLIYVRLAESLQEPLPEGHFPAEFSFVEGRSMRPDKAIIKTCLRDGLLEAQANFDGGDRLVFAITNAGRALIDSRR